jgi:ribosomal protein S18 acetylase RimI-like enzyme
MDVKSLPSRPADPQDSRALAGLHHLSHTKSFQEFAAREWSENRNFQDYLEFWTAFLKEQGNRETTWTIWSAEDLVGTVTIRELENSSGIFRPSDPRGLTASQICVLRLMYVHPDFQRLGIGRRLMSFTRAFMEDADYHLGTLITHASNQRARKFYESQGWQLDEVFSQQVKEFFQEPEEMRVRARYILDPST